MPDPGGSKREATGAAQRDPGQDLAHDPVRGEGSDVGRADRCRDHLDQLGADHLEPARPAPGTPRAGRRWSSRRAPACRCPARRPGRGRRCRPRGRPGPSPPTPTARPTAPAMPSSRTSCMKMLVDPRAQPASRTPPRRANSRAGRSGRSGRDRRGPARPAGTSGSRGRPRPRRPRCRCRCGCRSGPGRPGHGARRRRGCRARRSPWSPPSTIGIAPASSTSPTVRSIASWRAAGSAGSTGASPKSTTRSAAKASTPASRCGPGDSSRHGSRAGRSERRDGRRRGRPWARRRSRRRRPRAPPGPRCTGRRRRSAARRNRASPRTRASARADRSLARSLPRPRTGRRWAAIRAYTSASSALGTMSTDEEPQCACKSTSGLPASRLPRRRSALRRRSPAAGFSLPQGDEDLLRRQRYRRPGRLRAVQRRGRQASGADRELPHLGLRLPRVDRAAGRPLAPVRSSTSRPPTTTTATS